MCLINTTNCLFSPKLESIRKEKRQQPTSQFRYDLSGIIIQKTAIYYEKSVIRPTIKYPS